jgi:hypothetical protein
MLGGTDGSLCPSTTGHAFIVDVRVPQRLGLLGELPVREAWRVKPVDRDGSVEELPLCLVLVEEKHVLDSDRKDLGPSGIKKMRMRLSSRVVRSPLVKYFFIASN